MMKSKFPFKLKWNCSLVDETIVVLGVVFVGGLVFHSHSLHKENLALSKENVEIVSAYTEHIDSLKQEVQFANEMSQARAERIEKLDHTLMTLNTAVETLQKTVEEQHDRIQFFLNNPPSRGVKK